MSPFLTIFFYFRASLNVNFNFLGLVRIWRRRAFGINIHTQVWRLVHTFGECTGHFIQCGLPWQPTAQKQFDTKYKAPFSCVDRKGKNWRRNQGWSRNLRTESLTKKKRKILQSKWQSLHKILSWKRNNLKRSRWSPQDIKSSIVESRLIT